MYQVYRLVIPWAGVAAVQVQGDGDGWLDILDPYARLHRGWVTDWNRPDRSLDPGATHIEAGERIQLELDEGTHLLVFATDEPGPVRLQVSVQLPWKGGPRRLE